MQDSFRSDEARQNRYLITRASCWREPALKAVRGLGADFEECLLLVDKMPFRGGADPSHSKRGFHTRVC